MEKIVAGKRELRSWNNPGITSEISRSYKTRISNNNIYGFHRKETNYLTFYNYAAFKGYTLLFLAATFQAFLLANGDRQFEKTVLETGIESYSVARIFVDIL